jgi:hypothetical protein
VFKLIDHCSMDGCCCRNDPSSSFVKWTGVPSNSPPVEAEASPKVSADGRSSVRISRAVLSGSENPVISAVGTRHPQTGFVRALTTRCGDTAAPRQSADTVQPSLLWRPGDKCCSRGLQGQRDARPVIHVWPVDPSNVGPWLGQERKVIQEHGSFRR